MGGSSALPRKPLVVAAIVGVVVGVLSLRPQDEGSRSLPGSGSTGATNAGDKAAAANAVLPAAGAAQATRAVVASADVEAWLAGAQGTDAAKRLESIKALAQAPRDRALPVLVQIAKRSVVERDRYAALDSLQVQGLQQGDADDAIHTVLRTLIYDSGDERMAESAQRVLDALDAGS